MCIDVGSVVLYTPHSCVTILKVCFSRVMNVFWTMKTFGNQVLISRFHEGFYTPKGF